ncbi:uncharacterized protein LOC119391716 [Rhipicephalus sanguineus]|uniref:uncharacterized protein LOC119391716 n=1 Tax=Rhipicephalus sanguineus TaxID=34632 RepID=UPI0020C5548B|nr:uncharacterized protein LOC119391716 [Rhipicephalus sanguineus]
MSPPRPVPRPPLHHAGHSQHGAPPAPPAALPFYMDDVINADVGRNASAFHPLIVPWNVNENDILDLGDFEEDLQQYISYRGSSPIENYIDGYGALPSHLSFGGAVDALGTNPPIHAQRFQWQDEHRQRLRTERQQRQEHAQIEESEEEQQVAERQGPRQQRQQQERSLLQQQRSLFGYRRTRRQDQSEAVRAAATNENPDAEQAQRAARDHRSQGDGVTESNRRRGSNATNLEYEQLPLD